MSFSSRWRGRAVGAAGVVFVWAAVAGVATSRPLPQRGQDRPTFSSKADLVVLHVTVKDRRGAYVTGLPQEAFTVLEDGQPQAVTAFTAEDSPVTIGLIIDSSGSMREGREQVVAAAAAFAASSHPQDDLFALTFNEHVRTVLPKDVLFTSEPATLHAALGGAIQAVGRSALYDAIAGGLDHVEQGHHPRRVLVVVADGGDNASLTTFEQVLRRAQASNAAIYTVGVIDPLERSASRKRLRDLARATGGESFFPRRIEDVGKVLGQIAREIRHTYTIGYAPTDSTPDGTYHRVRVMVRAPDGRTVTIRTREGYRTAGSALREP